MEQKDTITLIQIMNELIRCDFLKFKQININTDFFNKLINKKKISKLNKAFDSNTEQNIDKKIYSSEFSTETPINDSIVVTNFTIPSSIYNNSITASNINKKPKYKFSNSTATNIS